MFTFININTNSCHLAHDVPWASLFTLQMCLSSEYFWTQVPVMPLISVWGNEASYVPSHFQRPFLPQSSHPFTSFSCLIFCVPTLGVCFLLSHQFIFCTFHCLPILIKTSFLFILIQFSWIFFLYISSM